MIMSRAVQLSKFSSRFHNNGVLALLMAHQPARHQKIWKYKLKYGRKVYIVYLRVQENVVMVSKTLRLIFLHFCWLQARHKKWWWWWEKQQRQSINAFWNLTSISPSSCCSAAHLTFSYLLLLVSAAASINALVSSSSRPLTKNAILQQSWKLRLQYFGSQEKTISIVSSLTVCTLAAAAVCTI